MQTQCLKGSVSDTRCVRMRFWMSPLPQTLLRTCPWHLCSMKEFTEKSSQHWMRFTLDSSSHANIFDRSCRSRNWRKANIAVIFKKANVSTLENYGPTSFYLVPGKNQETRAAETQFWGYEGQSACEESVLTKAKSLLRNLFASCAKQMDLWMRLD